MNWWKSPRLWMPLIALLLLALIVLFAEAVRPYRGPTAPFDEPTRYHNTKWVCQEADVYFLVDRHGNCYGQAAGTAEPLCFSTAADTVSNLVTLRVCRVDGAQGLDGIANRESGEIVLEAVIYSTKKEFTLPLDTSVLPLWGITAPATLHFIREELEEPVDFYGPDCPICYPDNHQLDDYPNTRWVCQEADMYFLEDCRGTCYGEAVVDGVSVFFSLARKESAGVEAYQCYTDTLEGIAGAPRSQEPVFQGAFACTQEGGEFGGMADYFHLWEAPGTLPMKVREITLTFLREELPEPVDFSKVSP